MRKQYLFIMRRQPHQGLHAQETLDMLLTAAAFDQPVSVLFVDDGVFQLKSGQNPEVLGLKDTSAIFRALAVYDVNDLYIEQESLQARGLDPADLILPVQVIARNEVNALMQRHQVIIQD